MTTHHLIPLYSIVLILSLIFSATVNSQGTDPKQFIASLGEETISAITKPNVAPEKRLQEFERLFRKGFDVSTISRFVLGRYWRQASPEQRTQYQTLFADFIVNTYASRFGQYSGESLVVIDARKVSDRDTVVSSEVNTPNGPAVRVSWRLRWNDTSYKIIDVIVEGISMALTQRDEFASVIRRGGGKIDTLIKELERKSRPESWPK